MGRGVPCNFRNKPHALHSTAPDSSRRHSGVVEVVQFWQTGWALPLARVAIVFSISELRSFLNGEVSYLEFRVVRAPR